MLVTGADEVSEPERKTITVEVWDYKMVNHFRGVAQVPLKDVLDNHRVRDTFRWLPCPSNGKPGFGEIRKTVIRCSDAQAAACPCVCMLQDLQSNLLLSDTLPAVVSVSSRGKWSNFCRRSFQWQWQLHAFVE